MENKELEIGIIRICVSVIVVVIFLIAAGGYLIDKDIFEAVSCLVIVIMGVVLLLWGIKDLTKYCRERRK